jgi:hypothetical protein
LINTTPFQILAKFAQNIFSDIDFTLKMEPNFERGIDPLLGRKILFNGGRIRRREVGR